MRKEKHFQRKHVSLSGLQNERLQRLATVSGMSLSELVRQAVDLYLDQREHSLGLTPIRGDARLNLKSDDS